MPTNRPFLANFLAAFRAHSVLQQSSTSASSASSTAVTQTVVSGANNASSSASASAARTISTKAAPTGPTAAAVQAAGHLQSVRRQHSTSPTSRSPAASAVASPTHGSLGPSAAPRRRSSSSSAEGFREVLGGEKWYIGGRSAVGEETFHRLKMAKRHRSIERLSIDRLSI